MESSKISSLSTMASYLPVEPSIGASMTDVHTASPILDADSMRKLRSSSSSSNEMPSKVEKHKSLFSTDEQKKNAKNLALQDVKGSNTVSNDKKAQGQIILSGLSLAIGAILAPFTGGLSLIPTAFVVFYGNTAALAMYGGNQFFVDDEKKEEDDDPDLVAPLSPDEYLPSNTLDKKEEIQLEPDLIPAHHLEEASENDQPDSAGVKSDKINQRIVEDIAKAAEIATPEYLIQREDIATVEHQAQSEVVNNSFEWVILDNGEESDERAALTDALELASKMSIEDCINYGPSLELLDFSSPVEHIAELDDLNITLDPKCVASNAIHIDDNIKMFAIRNIADIPESDQPKQVSQENLEIPQKFKFDVKMPNLIINTEGSSGPGSNRLSGIRNNTGSANVRIEPTLSITPQNQPKLTAQKSDFPVANNSEENKNNDNSVNNIDQPVASKVEKLAPKYTVNMPNSIISTQGSGGLSSNKSAGIRNNTGNRNSRIEPVFSPISKQPTELTAQMPKSFVSTDSIDGKNNDNDVNNIADSAQLKAEKPASKYTVNMPKPIITTQGSNALGSNRSVGVRNNESSINKTTKSVTPPISKQPPELMAQVSDSLITTNSVDKKNNKINNVVKPAPKYTVNISKPIITTQGSNGLGSNRSIGVRNNENSVNKAVKPVLSSVFKQPSMFTAHVASPPATGHSTGGRSNNNDVNTSFSNQSPKFTVKMPDRIVTTQSSSGLGSNRSAGVRNNENAVNQTGESALSKIPKLAPNFTIKTVPPIVTTQGRSGLGSNNSAGIRHNVKEIHNDNVSKLASSYWKKTGIDKPVSLNIMGNTLVTRPVDLSKLDYVTVKGKAS